MTDDAVEQGVEQLIARLEAQRHELAEQLARVDRSIALQRAALADMRGEEPAATTKSRGRLDTARSRLVQRALDEAGAPLSRRALAVELERLGHPTELDDISSTLTYLRRTGVVERAGGGAWTLAAPSLTRSAAAE